MGPDGPTQNFGSETHHERQGDLDSLWEPQGQHPNVVHGGGCVHWPQEPQAPSVPHVVLQPSSPSGKPLKPSTLVRIALNYMQQM